MPATEGWIRRYAVVVAARPRTVLALCVAATVVLAWRLPQFRIDAGADTLLTHNNVHYLRTRLVEERFSPEEFLLVVYRPRQAAVFEPQSLQDVQRLAAGLRKIGRVEAVVSIQDAPLLPRQGGLQADLDPQRWTLAQRKMSPAQLREYFAGHPVYENLLVNRDQSATAMKVLFRADPQLDRVDREMTPLLLAEDSRGLSSAQAARLAQLQDEREQRLGHLDAVRSAELDQIRALAGEFAVRADIYVGGNSAIARQLIQIISHDLWVFGSAIAALSGLILLAVFRRLRWVLVPAACCAASLVATLGLFGWLDLEATVISSSFVALQLILTLALVIHMIVQYRESAAAHPRCDQAQWVRDTLQRKVLPCFYAGLTNVVGFASLWSSGIQPVIDFGWMMSVAMFVSIGVCLVLFPALMALLPAESPPAGPPPGRGLLDGCTRLVLAHPRRVVVAGVVVALAGAAGIPRLSVENSFIHYFDRSTDAYRELSYIDREFGGTTPLDLSYAFPDAKRDADLVAGAGSIQALEAIQSRLERQPGVGNVLSVVNFTRWARELNGGRPLTEYELTALYWLLDANVRDRLFGSYLDPRGGQARVAARIQDATPGLNREQLLADIRGDLQALGIPSSQYLLTGLFVMYQDILQQLYRGQVLTLGWSFGVLTLALYGVFRSVRVALIGIVPNILSTLVVLGLMGWLGIALDLMTIMIASVAMGITVDDTIHYIHRYLEERRHPGSGAVARTQGSVGHALLYTTVIVVTGFSLLVFSNFLPSVLFGLLTALAMALAATLDLTLLPVLLHRFVPAGVAGPSAPARRARRRRMHS